MSSDYTENKLESGDAAFIKDNEDVSIKPTSKLIGLTKEELEQYRNDPVWKTVRYLIFALFWLIWILMFVGAILIVVFSPKCAGVKCEDNMIRYQIFTPKFYASNNQKIGDFKGINEKLVDLKSFGISAILPIPIFQTDNDNSDFLPQAVTNIDEFDKRLGGKSQLETLISGAHNSLISVIFDVPLVVSNNTILNSWVTGTANVDAPLIMLNLENEKVFDKLHDVAIKLLKLGADGLRFTDYGFAAATHTFPKLNSLIEKIKKNATENYEINQKHVAFFIESKFVEKITEANYIETKLLDGINEIDDIGNINKIISNSLENRNMDKTFWKFSDLVLSSLNQLLKNLNLNLQKNAAVALQFIQLILPGPINIYIGEEMNMKTLSTNDKMIWENLKNEDEQKHLNALKSVANLRQSSNVFRTGLFNTMKNDSIYFYLRQIKDKVDENVYVLAVNLPKSKKKTEIKSATFPKSWSLKFTNVKVISQWPTKSIEKTINLVKEEVILEPYEAALFQFS